MFRIEARWLQALGEQFLEKMTLDLVLLIFWLENELKVSRVFIIISKFSLLSLANKVKLFAKNIWVVFRPLLLTIIRVQLRRSTS